MNINIAVDEMKTSRGNYSRIAFHSSSWLCVLWPIYVEWK